MVTMPARVPSSRLQDGRQFRVVMATRREPTECGGVERVVAGLIAELERSRPDWRVECVAAFPAGSRIEGVDLLADVIAGLRLGWRLRTHLSGGRLRSLRRGALGHSAAAAAARRAADSSRSGTARVRRPT